MPRFEVIWYERKEYRSVVDVETEDAAYDWERILENPYEEEGGYECDILVVKEIRV
jgi:hypothetical protein